MNLREISYSLKKWLLVLGIGLFFGLWAGFLGIKIQKPVYQATAKILVASSPQSTTLADLINPNITQATQTYMELLKTKPILDAASATLGFVVDPLNISVIQGSSSQIIHIIVEDNNPKVAAQTANTLVQVLIDQTNSAQSGLYTTYETALNDQILAVQQQIESFQGQIQQINEASIQEQLNQVNGQIAQLQAEIAVLEQDIAKFPLYLSSSQRASLAQKQTQLDQDKSLLSLYNQIQTNLTYLGQPAQVNTTREDVRVASVQGTLNLYQQLYISLMNNLQNLQLTRLQNTSIVTQIDPAVPPLDPIRPKPLLYMILAGMAGMILAFGVILIMGYFDTSIKFSGDVEELLGLPVVGEIPSQKLPKNLPSEPDNLFIHDAQGFQKLAAILDITKGETPIQTLLVTSPESGEGKTTVATNLASIFSHQGKSVLLIDANIKHPRMHSLLGLNEEKGFAEILNGGKDIAPQQYQKGDDSGFMVLPAGESNQHNEVYQGKKVAQTLTKLQKQADLIILDGPPMTSGDAYILAAQADGVLIVLQSGRTRIAYAVSTAQQLKRQGAKILGIVLNRAPKVQ